VAEGKLVSLLIGLTCLGTGLVIAIDPSRRRWNGCWMPQSWSGAWVRADKNGRKLTRNEFSIDVMVERNLAVYRELVPESKG
jgi:hypothetical protein